MQAVSFSSFLSSSSSSSSSIVRRMISSSFSTIVLSMIIILCSLSQHSASVVEAAAPPGCTKQFTCLEIQSPVTGYHPCGIWIPQDCGAPVKHIVIENVQTPNITFLDISGGGDKPDYVTIRHVLMDQRDHLAEGQLGYAIKFTNTVTNYSGLVFENITWLVNTDPDSTNVDHASLIRFQDIVSGHPHEMTVKNTTMLVKDCNIDFQWTSSHVSKFYWSIVVFLKNVQNTTTHIVNTNTNLYMKYFADSLRISMVDYRGECYKTYTLVEYNNFTCNNAVMTAGTAIQFMMVGYFTIGTTSHFFNGATIQHNTFLAPFGFVSTGNFIHGALLYYETAPWGLTAAQGPAPIPQDQVVHNNSVVAKTSCVGGDASQGIFVAILIQKNMRLFRPNSIFITENYWSVKQTFKDASKDSHNGPSLVLSMGFRDISIINISGNVMENSEMNQVGNGPSIFTLFSFSSNCDSFEQILITNNQVKNLLVTSPMLSSSYLTRIAVLYTTTGGPQLLKGTATAPLIEWSGNKFTDCNITGGIASFTLISFGNYISDIDTVNVNDNIITNVVAKSFAMTSVAYFYIFLHSAYGLLRTKQISMSRNIVTSCSISAVRQATSGVYDANRLGDVTGAMRMDDNVFRIEMEQTNPAGPIAFYVLSGTQDGIAMLTIDRNIIDANLTDLSNRGQGANVVLLLTRNYYKIVGSDPVDVSVSHNVISGIHKGDFPGSVLANLVGIFRINGDFIVHNNTIKDLNLESVAVGPGIIGLAVAGFVNSGYTSLTEFTVGKTFFLTENKASNVRLVSSSVATTSIPYVAFHGYQEFSSTPSKDFSCDTVNASFNVLENLFLESPAIASGTDSAISIFRTVRGTISAGSGAKLTDKFYFDNNTIAGIHLKSRKGIPRIAIVMFITEPVEQVSSFSVSDNVITNVFISASTGGGLYIEIGILFTQATTADFKHINGPVTISRNILRNVDASQFGRLHFKGFIAYFAGLNNSYLPSLEVSSNQIVNVTGYGFQGMSEVAVLFALTHLSSVDHLTVSHNVVREIEVACTNASGASVAVLHVGKNFTEIGSGLYPALFENNTLTDAVVNISNASARSALIMVGFDEVAPTGIHHLIIRDSVFQRVTVQSFRESTLPSGDLTTGLLLLWNGCVNCKFTIERATVRDIKHINPWITTDPSVADFHMRFGAIFKPFGDFVSTPLAILDSTFDEISFVGKQNPSDSFCNKSKTGLILSTSGNIQFGPGAPPVAGDSFLTIQNSRLGTVNSDYSSLLVVDGGAVIAHRDSPPSSLPYLIKVNNSQINLTQSGSALVEPAMTSAVFLQQAAGGVDNFTVHISQTTVSYQVSPPSLGSTGCTPPNCPMVTLFGAEFASTPPRLVEEFLTVDSLSSASQPNVTAAFVSWFRNSASDASICYPALTTSVSPSTPTPASPMNATISDSTVTGGNVSTSFFYPRDCSFATTAESSYKLSRNTVKKSLSPQAPAAFGVADIFPSNWQCAPTIIGTFTLSCNRWTRAEERTIKNRLGATATVIVPANSFCFTNTATESFNNTRTRSQSEAVTQSKNFSSPTRTLGDASPTLSHHETRSTSLSVLPPTTTTTTNTSTTTTSTTTNTSTTTTTSTTETNTTANATTTTSTPTTAAATSLTPTTTMTSSTTTTLFVNNSGSTFFKEPKRFALDEADATRFTLTGAAFVSTVIEPAAPYVAARSLAVVYLSSCSLSAKAQPFPISMVPSFTIGSDSSPYKYFRGTILINIVAIVIIYLLLLLGGLIMLKVSPGSAGNCDSDSIIIKACTCIFLPSSGVLFSAVSNDGILSSSATLISSSPTDDGALDAVLVGVGFIVVFVPAIALTKLTYNKIVRDEEIIYAPSKVVVHRSVPTCVANMVSGKFGEFVFFGSNAWLSKTMGQPIPAPLRRIRLAYWSARQKRGNESACPGNLAPMIVCFEFYITVVISFIRGLKLNCRPILYAIAALCCLFALLLIILKPYKVILKNILGALSSIMTAGAAVIIAIVNSHDEPDPSMRSAGERLALAAAFIGMAKVPILAFRFLLQKCFKITQEREGTEKNKSEYADVLLDAEGEGRKKDDVFGADEFGDVPLLEVPSINASPSGALSPSPSFSAAGGATTTASSTAPSPSASFSQTSQQQQPATLTNLPVQATPQPVPSAAAASATVVVSAPTTANLPPTATTKTTANDFDSLDSGL